ncbi:MULTISPECIES: hypothetical protein [unclassified Flavobacterium]|uniref:hypothetical protein n=1 Tax=unclassified Flavobacterium TaxID=196869 RepID=UPI0036141A49
MKILVLSISFFILTVSPFTCSSEVIEVAENQEQAPAALDAVQENVEIDPIVMPKKP